jgi:hypothetical protein
MPSCDAALQSWHVTATATMSVTWRYGASIGDIVLSPKRRYDWPDFRWAVYNHLVPATEQVSTGDRQNRGWCDAGTEAHSTAIDGNSSRDTRQVRTEMMAYTM